MPLRRIFYRTMQWDAMRAFHLHSCSNKDKKFGQTPRIDIWYTQNRSHRFCVGFIFQAMSAAGTNQKNRQMERQTVRQGWRTLSLCQLQTSARHCKSHLPHTNNYPQAKNIQLDGKAARPTNMNLLCAPIILNSIISIIIVLKCNNNEAYNRNQRNSTIIKVTLCK